MTSLARMKTLDTERERREGKKVSGRRIVRFGDHVEPDVKIYFRERGWHIWNKEAGHSEHIWHLWWQTRSFSPDIHDDAKAYQRINKLTHGRAITCKDLLAKNLERMRVRFGPNYDFAPKTWVIPAQAKQVSEAVRGLNHENGDPPGFICKPARMSRGRGIFLFSSQSELKQKMDLENEKIMKNREEKQRRQSIRNGRSPPTHTQAKVKSQYGLWVVQRYLSRPYLLGGKKFDMRTYALVPSTWPFLALVYKRGLVRLGTENYTNASSDNIYAHLTNYSINKDNPEAKSPKIVQKSTENGRTSENFTNISALAEDGGGLKWTIEELLRYLGNNGVDTVRVWKQTKDLMLKTLIALIPDCKLSPCSFELFGFDIMMDQDVNLHLIEVNMEPSLAMPSPLDKKLKTSILNDIIQLLKVDVLASHPPPGPPPVHPHGAAVRLLRRIRKKKDPKSISALVKGYGGCFNVHPGFYGDFEQVYPMDAASMIGTLELVAKV
ncbi:hypothetical protein AAMO2058_000532900, partial [Amorphochlora amoebiformis]